MGWTRLCLGLFEMGLMERTLCGRRGRRLRLNRIIWLGLCLASGFRTGICLCRCLVGLSSLRIIVVGGIIGRSRCLGSRKSLPGPFFGNLYPVYSGS